jgi:hypothetical protein
MILVGYESVHKEHKIAHNLNSIIIKVDELTRLGLQSALVVAMLKRTGPHGASVSCRLLALYPYRKAGEKEIYCVMPNTSKFIYATSREVMTKLKADLLEAEVSPSLT